MPPDLPHDQELTLKKRARRRLVGAIALVLLMIIILPQVLQDRALMAQHEPIRITMPAVNSPASQEAASQNATERPSPNSTEIISDDHISEPSLAIAEPVTGSVTANQSVENTGNQHNNLAAHQAELKPAVKVPENIKPDTALTTKPQDSFTVQVGVYADADNVKRLQQQLTQAGFSTTTEKVKTPKGDSLRLKAGQFSSRQDAEAALSRIKTIGLSGIIVGNE